MGRKQMNQGNIGATSALKSFIGKDVISHKHSGAYWEQFTRDSSIKWTNTL